MLQKLKPKNSLRVGVICLFLAVVAGGFFVPAGAALAESYDAKKYEVSTETEVAGSGGSMVNDVLVRALEGRSANLNVVLTLTNLLKNDGTSGASLDVGKDVMNFDTTFGERPVTEFGVGLEPAGTGNTCNGSGIVGLVPFFSTNKGFLTCAFPGGTAKVTTNPVMVGQANKVSITVDSSKIAALGLNRPCSRNGGTTTACFTVYPYVKVRLVTGGTATVAFNAAAKDVYVQYFKTQAELDQALASGQRPSDVPAYGGRTGSSGVSDQGSGIAGMIAKIIGALVGLVQELLYLVFFWLIAPMIQAMLSIRTYTDTFAGVIYPAWILIRNMCNILFIVSIIAIGLGTLFRVEAYEYKHLLVQLIIAALLVNFSLVIAQAILGFADTVQNQFLPDNVEVLRGLAKELMLGYRETVWNTDFKTQGDFAGIIKPLFNLALALGTFAVFAAIGIFLVIRIAMLWVLLMISPMAYVAKILPTTAKYSEEWWSNFIKYAFFTPIMAFFLNVAAVIANLQKNNPVLQTISADDLGGSGVAVFVFKVASNIILLVFLVAALQVADKLGIYGAHAITEFGQNAMFKPFKAAGALAGRGSSYLGTKWDQRTAHLLEQHGDHPVGFKNKALFAVLNPVAFAKGLNKRSEELKHHAEEEAGAAGRMVAEQLMTRGKVQIPYNQFVARNHENEFMKDYGNMKKETLMSAAVKLQGMKGAEGDMRRRAIVKAAAQNGYLDDLMRMKEFAIQYADEDGTISSEEIIDRFFYGYLGENEQTMRMLAEDFEDIGRQTNHWEYMGHAYYDNNEKKWKRGMEVVGKKKITRNGREVELEVLKNNWQSDFAAGELEKADGRTRNKIAPHVLKSYRAKVDASGNIIAAGDEIQDIIWGRPDGSSTTAQQAAGKIMNSADTARDATFSQARLKDRMFSPEVDALTGDVVVKDASQVASIQSYWHNMNLHARVLYQSKTGIDQNQVTGFKVVWYEPDGTKMSADIGDPTRLPNPYQTMIADTILTDRGLSTITKVDKDKKFELFIRDIVKRSKTGALSEAQLLSEARAVLTSFPSSGVSEDEVKNIVYKVIESKVSESYNPISALTNVKESLRLNMAELGKIDIELSHAVGDAYKYAAQNSVDLRTAPPELRSRVQTALSTALASINAERTRRGETPLPATSITPEMVNRFVENAKG